ncbi:MAG: flagellar biosynthetic protein FliQ [Actinomycetes bacterium]|jgi:flagellar biosynthetic protein FliQ|nr:MAG: flagellar export apparatus protein FliQ [Actinomycetota bacterium]
MTDAQVLDILVDALVVAAKLAGPFLVAAALIGIGVSLLQTITQVQEMTLTFVPKLVGAALILVFGGSWMLREIVTWVKALWSSIPGL